MLGHVLGEFSITRIKPKHEKKGVVRMKHIGPLTPEVIQNEIEPLLRKLNA